MKAIACLAWFVSAFALAAAQNTKSPTMRPIAAADESRIRAASKAYETACNHRDWAAVLEIFSDDIVFLPPHGPTRSGKPEARAYLDAFPAFRDLRLEIQEMSGSADLAFVRGRYSFVLTPANQPEQSDTGKYIEIWRKDGNAWRYARGIFNSDQPLPSPANADLTQVKTTITAAINAALDATEKRDESCFKSFSSEAQVRFASQGTPLLLSEFKERWRAGSASTPKQEFSERKTGVQLLSPDVAVSTTHGHYRSFNPSGTPSAKVPFVFSAVWRREGSDWRIVDAHESVRTDWPAAQ